MTATAPLVIHVIDELKIGGAQTHLVTMLREARERGTFKHRVVGLFGDGRIGDQVRALDIPVDVLDLGNHFRGRRFDRAVRDLTALFRQHRPAVAEGHLTWSRLLALPAAWRAGVPVRIGYEQGDVYLDSWKFRVANFVWQAAADRIVVCSEALAGWNHRTHRISKQRLTVFYNCVDIRRFDPARHHGSEPPFARPPVRTVFVAVGTLGRGVDKRVDVAIRAVAAARQTGADVGLVIAGDGAQRTDLEALAASLDLAEVVRFLGMRPDVPAVIGAADAFVHAAPFEPFGIVCVEAMAMQLPALVPDTGGMQEAVEHAVTGLVYPALDHVALGQAMARLDREPHTRREMGERGREKVSREFAVDGYMQRLDALYLRLLDEKRP